MTSNIKELDPVQGLIDYIEDIKPYHTKVVEVLTEYVYNELINTTITERFESAMEMIYPSPEAQDEILALCGFGGANPWDGFTAWPVIPENVTLVLGPFLDTPAGYDTVAGTVKIPGDRTKQYLVGRDITIDLYIEDTVLDTRVFFNQSIYPVVASEFVTFGQINGVANTLHTVLTVSGLLNPPPLAGDEVYAAEVNFDPYPIDSVVGYSNAAPVFYTDVPPGADPLPTPTIGSLSQTPDENPLALVFSNSFVLLGDFVGSFPQGFILNIIGGTTEGEYTVKYSFYDSVGDLTYVRVVEEIDIALVESQDETDYDNVLPNGTFVGGDGAGGTAYVALDTITLSDGSIITVDSVDANDDVLTFTVTIASGNPINVGDVLTQASTSGTGTAFTLTVQIANVFVAGDIHERFFGYDECAVSQGNVPVGLTDTQMVESLVFSWSLPTFADVIDGFQFFVKEAVTGTSTFQVNDDAIADISIADTIRVIGSQNNNLLYTVSNITLAKAIIESEDETDYNNILPNGTFFGGVAYNIGDTITLSDGSTITVDNEAGNVVTEFTVTTSLGASVTAGDVLTQTSTSGGGSTFTLTVQTANLIDAGTDIEVAPAMSDNQTGLVEFALREEQSDVNYDGTVLPDGLNGTFVGGDGPGGTAYSPGDTITLSDGSTITVDSRLLVSQDETDYDGAGSNGTFVGGDGAGGTAYSPGDTITLSDGSVLTVDVVDGNGDVTDFTVTSRSVTNVVLSVVLTQISSSGTGDGFTLTPESANVSESVNVDGDVTDFGITTASLDVVTFGVTLTQTGTSGTGTGFTLTPESANAYSIPRGWIEKFTP